MRPVTAFVALAVVCFLAHAASAQSRENSDPEKEFYRLTESAPAEFSKGNFERAAGVAEELLKTAPLWEKNWNYGNAIHAANVVLGRIALRGGKTDDAKSYLLAAGRTPGSPQLDTFGPDMLLAKELLAKKETEVVLEYFDLCEKFWKMEKGSLNKWRSAVKAGEMPDFGPNLRYYAY